MKIKIAARVANKLKADFNEQFKEVFSWVDSDEESWRDMEVDLAKMTEGECARMVKLLETCGIQGTKVIAADIEKYLRAAREGIDKITARTVRQAAWMLEHYIAQLPHHLIFSQDDYEGGSYVGYYVDEVQYIPEREGYGGRDKTPEHVYLRLVHIENDSRQKSTIELYEDKTLGKKPEEILNEAGYVAETPTLMKRLEEETVLYYEIREKIGRKYTARGIGLADLDDLTQEKHSYHSDKRLRMDLFGKETPVVVDVLYEKEIDDSRDRSVEVRLYRWHPWNMRFFTPSEDDLARHLKAEESTDFRPQLQIPVHPLVPCFDFRRHKRVRVHVNNLTEYVFRKEVFEGLVLPERDKKLIETLINHSSNAFEDVVAGKGQSMNVLLGGSPGTGKTLSCEVFAEWKERALYSVQCSQLGLEPDEIESKLSVILQRANRWNAVLLLDEADVYIRERGHDITHNAIVGVFLRMLEYAECILFMTTNLPDSVDDAIASRCVVAIRYEVPNRYEQAKIWRTLADINKLSISDTTIEEFAERNPHISGRDVKNLLKLASFIASGKITLNTLTEALQYKPTASVKGGK